MGTKGAGLYVVATYVAMYFKCGCVHWQNMHTVWRTAVKLHSKEDIPQFLTFMLYIIQKEIKYYDNNESKGIPQVMFVGWWLTLYMFSSSTRFSAEKVHKLCPLGGPLNPVGRTGCEGLGLGEVRKGG